MSIQRAVEVARAVNSRGETEFARAVIPKSETGTPPLAISIKVSEVVCAISIREVTKVACAVIDSAISMAELTTHWMPKEGGNG